VKIAMKPLIFPVDRIDFLMEMFDYIMFVINRIDQHS